MSPMNSWENFHFRKSSNTNPKLYISRVRAQVQGITKMASPGHKKVPPLSCQLLEMLVPS